MAQDEAAPPGPDLSQGIPLSQLSDGKLLGHVGEQPVLLVRSGTETFAVDPYCSHYHAPLVDGLVVGSSIRCPWHHACFDLRSGEATRAPALTSLACWPVEATAKVGDTLELVNKDVLVHTATASNGDFDVMMPPNKTVTYVLKKAGAIDYYCRFHPNMKATLKVEP